MKTQFKIIGLDRDGGDCECCGKKDLRKLVIVRVVKDGEETESIRIGTGCAAKMARKTNISANAIETAARNVTDFPNIVRPTVFE